MNATTSGTPATLQLLCAWCRRDNPTATDNPRAIVGLCDHHVKGFFARVDDVLRSCAAMRKQKSESSETELVEEEVPAETLAKVLRHHAGLTFCDACLGAEADWPVERVTYEASALDRSEFLRDEWRCARCGARGLVTRTRTRRSYTVADVAKAA